MKKFNFNLKKNVAISVFVVLALVLGTGLISYISKEHNAKDTQISVKDNKTEIKVPVINSNDRIEKPSEDNTVSTKPETVKQDTVPLKPETPKVKPKTQDATTNKDKVPTYTEKQVKPQPQTAPKGGETNSKGQIYLPGFGWVDNQGGGGQGTNVSSDGDINKQVGTMN